MMPFILLAVIVLAGVSQSWMPLVWQSIFYALSLSLKSVIIFILPFLIFTLLFKAAVQLSKRATKAIFVIVLAICASNFLSTLLSYTVGHCAYQLDLSMALPSEGVSLAPAWQFSLPKWIGNDRAMVCGILFGVILSLWKPERAQAISARLEQCLNFILRGLLAIIPLFIAGFVIKMSHDGVILSIVRDYAQIFAIVAAAVFVYVLLIYFAANRFCVAPWLQSLKNMLPAGMAGFGSMSSAAAMPLTILGTEKNAQNRDLARSIIPATVNVHLIGDCFAIPIFAFAVLKNFGVAEPAFLTYLIFAGYFVLAKFSVAAVPGGGILVMLPILENYLGFDSAMLSLITALYILFDPVITCANVMGNGGFAMVLSRMFKRVAETPS